MEETVSPPGGKLEKPDHPAPLRLSVTLIVLNNIIVPRALLWGAKQGSSLVYAKEQGYNRPIQKGLGLVVQAVTATADWRSH
jgi:hypothetical protein